MWVGPAVTTQLTRTLDVLVAATRLAEEAARRVPLAGRVAQTSVYCPICRAMMQRLHYQNADLVLDSCTAHGTWFDRGEMQRVAQLVTAMRGKDQGPYRGGGTEGIGQAVVLPPQHPAADSSNGFEHSRVDEVAGEFLDTLAWLLLGS